MRLVARSYNGNFHASCRYKQKDGDDVTNAKNFQVHLNGAKEGDDLADMNAFYEVPRHFLSSYERPLRLARGRRCHEQVVFCGCKLA